MSRLVFSILASPTKPYPTNVSFLTLLRFAPIHAVAPFSTRSSDRVPQRPPFSMPKNRKGKGTAKEQQWMEKPKASSSCAEGVSPTEAAVDDGLTRLSLAEASAHSTRSPTSPLLLVDHHLDIQNSPKAQRAIWKPRSYATITESNTVDSSDSPFGAKFTLDNQTFARAQIRATFYPKFENEKSDQEIRTRMIEMVSHGLATLEVSLKHSGSLFMYAGHEGGAYAKNSFGNVYTAVGVFVLSRMFLEAWGTQAMEKQAEFNNFLEENKMCVSMELVTAVLGDHGQRPLQDYVVVTAITEMGSGKPKFYSTPQIIVFCRKWRLPTNHVWLFSTRKSVTSFFAAYDALSEEGTASPVCQALDEASDISVPGSKDHVKVQGEILEGLVARIVSPESSKHLEEVLKEFPFPSVAVGQDTGASLREICAAHRSDEKEQIKALLKNSGAAMCPDDSDWFGDGGGGGHSRNADRSILSKFLQAHPSDFSTTKLQELIRLMRQRHFPAAFKCYPNFHKIDSLSNDNLHFKMVIHVFSDSVFRRYQQEMRRNRGLWPLYRGFFVDVNLFKVNKEKEAELVQDSNSLLQNMNGGYATPSEGLADEDANLMIKLKFLTYKIRTFLIRNGLSVLFKDGPSAYKTYYLRQMKNWGTSAAKQRELSKMLDEWAVYIRRKCGNKQLSASTYLTEAEPFLEQYAKRSPENQALVGAAGNLVKTAHFMAIIEGGRDEEGDLIHEGEAASQIQIFDAPDVVPKDEGLIVFFPGMPGCAKSALCRELLNAECGLGDDRPIHSLMGDLIKGRYWQKVAEERKRKPYCIILADKNAPNEEVWRQIEDMCRSTKASAVPVVPDSEGTESNPFSLDALAVFIFRVLQRVNHPGNLDKASPNAGYVLLMFYHLYDGKSRRDFESELSERFGSLVRMPLLTGDRSPLPDPVTAILKEGISLFNLHSSKHGRLEPSKGTYAKEWARWEKRMREVILGNADYFNSVQVPFDFAVNQVLEQLKAVAKGEYRVTSAEKMKLGNIVFAAVSLPVDEIRALLDKVAEKDIKAAGFLKTKDIVNTFKAAHVTLAHKRSHGVAAVASYGVFLQRDVPVELTALLFSDKLAAFEARVGSVDGELIISKNQWPHITIWTGPGTTAKEANTLPQLVSEGKGTRIDINPPVSILGKMNFF